MSFNFKLEANPDTLYDIFKVESIDIYIKKARDIQKLKKQNYKYSERQRLALEEGRAHTNANHKSDMGIRQNNIQIERIQLEMEALDKEFEVLDRLYNNLNHQDKLKKLKKIIEG